MASRDVVCLKCGYDLRANVVREVETGVAEEPETDPGGEGGGAKAVFVQPGRLTVKSLLITGAVLTVGAAVAAGVFAPAGSGAWLVLGLVLLCLYQIVVHSVTGVGAVAVAARMRGARFGSIELALGRVFVAFSLFQLISRLRLPLGWSVANVGLPWVLACGAYFGALMILFRKDRATTALIALAHFILWILLNAGMELSRMVGSAIHALAPGGSA